MTKKDDNIKYLAIGAIGLYVLARPTYESILAQLLKLIGRGGETPPAGTTIAMEITDPSPGEDWSVLRPHTVDVMISNATDRDYRIYVGMTIQKPDGTYIDYDPKAVTLNAHSNKSLNWLIALAQGSYKVRSSAWRVYPVAGTPETDRIGDTGWIDFIMSLTAIV